MSLIVLGLGFAQSQSAIVTRDALLLEVGDKCDEDMLGRSAGRSELFTERLQILRMRNATGGCPETSVRSYAR